MKIAILTLPLYTNYGGILQCYALQTVLQKMGHTVNVLAKPKYGRLYYIMYPLTVCKKLFKRYILGQKVNILMAPYEVVIQNLDRFIKCYIHLYRCKNWDLKLVNKFDAVVVGSDQVWRPMYFQPIERAFLSFLEGAKIKRIAYAASFGVDYCEYTEEQLKNCSFLLRKFDAVSVRELSGVNICRNYLGVEAVQMLDPALLLSADDYRNLINKKPEEPLKGNMLIYILDKTPEKVSLVEKILEDKGLTPMWLDSPDEYNSGIPLENQIKMSVEQWLHSFDNADFIFTDSFHGCAFSIIFKKQFIVWGNEHRGIERVESLLTLLSVQERLIRSMDDYENKKIMLYKQIDYNKVDVKLDLERKRSLDFLSSNLGA